MRIFCILLMAGSLYAQPWVMFNDMDDTYLYDQASGQVYIRVKKGGKNYEDTFVKMGVIDNLQNNSSKASLSAESIQDKNTKEASEDQRELLKKAQELQRSIQNGIFEGE
ncbi:hypothetical protein HPU229334_05175 [Helicobacter pullorum]|uniref:Periplasmic protein n=2 Tax=Helicobacter pullorum TaxID=35818 RepID=A0A0N1MQN6_9HELI|nr:hypothetical protein HPU229334_05175 [Helicobacter pullorum]